MQKIRIDFDNPGLPQHISAVENDSQSRFFQVTLYENGKAYTAPEGAAYSIMYRGFGPQNQGWYDTINDGAGKRAACAVSGNVVTCEIARQALQVPGHVSIVLCVTTGKGYMLKSWPIECDCKNDRYDSTAEIQSFFYITQVSNADWTQAIQAWENLKDAIDPTLSLSGKAADAKAAGDAVGQLEEAHNQLTYRLDLVPYKNYAELLQKTVTVNGITVAIEGNQVSINGEVTAVTHLRITPIKRLIPKVKRARILFLNKTGTYTGSTAVYIFYNNGKQYYDCGEYNNVYLDNPDNIPDDQYIDIYAEPKAKFDNFSFYVQINEDGNGTPEKYKEIFRDSPYALSSDVDALSSDVDALSSDFYEMKTVQLNLSGYVRSDGEIIDDADGKRTDYIRVSNYTNVKITSTISESGAAIAFFDSEKNYIKEKSVIGLGYNVSHVYTSQIPNDAFYVMCSCYIHDAEAVLTNTNGYLSKKIKEFNEEKIPLHNEFCAVSKFGVIGDSLSVGYIGNMKTGEIKDRALEKSWPQILARICGNTAVNMGFSGATTKTWYTDKYYGLIDAIKPENKCELYIVGIGTNDRGTIGTIDDIDWDNYENNADSFYGNYAKIVQKLKEISPNAIVFVLTLPPDRLEENKNAAIKAIAESKNLKNVFLIDLNGDYGKYYNMDVITKYMYKYHYTSLGYANIAALMKMILSAEMEKHASEMSQIGFIKFD